MGLKTKIRNALKRPSQKEKAILRHEDVNAKYLDIKIQHTDIVDKINAFDWLDLGEAKNETEMSATVLRFFESFKIECPPAYKPIILKAFSLKFMQALKYLRDAIEEVNRSYNVEGTSRGFRNDVVDKFYYISYWAAKNHIAVNFNEKKQQNRELFNLDTIILSILADKLNAFNEFERNKPKPR